MTSKEEKTREKVLKAAEELFFDIGYDNISVRQIASKADVNLAAINYYFGGKQKLLGEVLKK
ncbi:TetR family transcriptional regulator, partial [Bacteriovoracales bacterium]|nr:TetR family transcriptional regulator [Bacteriovoracales bacterium]